MDIKVAALSGSLRKGSYTTRLVKAFQQLAPQGVVVSIIDISNLPMINQELESDLPDTVKELHNIVENADAVLPATPEYSRSYSPVLKNALDWVRGHGHKTSGRISRWA